LLLQTANQNNILQMDEGAFLCTSHAGLETMCNIDASYTLSSLKRQLQLLYLLFGGLMFPCPIGIIASKEFTLNGDVLQA
jgi:hypothetical protein